MKLSLLSYQSLASFQDEPHNCTDCTHSYRLGNVIAPAHGLLGMVPSIFMISSSFSPWTTDSVSDVLDTLH